MNKAFSLPSIIPIVLLSVLLGGCGDNGEEMSQEEIQYLSHIDQARFFQRQGELKASTIEARSAIELQPKSAEPYLIIINNLLTAGDARNTERQLNLLMEEIDPSTISQSTLNNAALVRSEANLMQGDFEEALKALDAMKSPDRAQEQDAALLKGQIHLASGNPEAALESYDHARSLAPDSAEPLVGLSKVAILEGQPEKAQDLIEKARDVDPQNPELALWVAQLAHRNGQWEKAEQAYIEALESIGQYDVMTYRKFETMSALIDVLREQGKAAEAFVYEEILSKSAPGTIRSNLIAAQEAVNQGNLDTAVRYLEETLNQAPNHEQAALMLGLIRYRQGRPEEAEALLEPLAALEGSEQAQKLLAATRLQQRNVAGAKEVLASVKDQGSDPETLALVGIASLVSGDKESGEQMIERSLELAPQNNSLRLRYAAYLTQEGQTAKAIDQIQTVIKNDPTLDQARLLLIQAHASADDLAAARKAAENWLKQQPDNLNAMIALGNIAARAGNPAEAETYFKKAAKADPKSAAPLVSLGTLSLSQKKPEQAETFFIRAIKLQPDNQQALRGLTSVMERSEITALMEDILKEQPDAIGPRLVLLESALIDGNQSKADELTAGLLERENADEPAPAANLVATVYHGIASQLAQRDQLEQAMNILRRGRVLFPENEQIGLQAAIVAFAQDDTQNAREILSDVKQSHPESAAPFIVEARYLQQQEKYKQAADLYQLALEKERTAELEVSYAQALAQDGQNAKALESLTAAQESFPNSETLLTNLAILQQQSGNTEAATKTYARLIEIAPNNVVALNNLAWMYHEQNNPQAVELARKAYELNSNNAAVADTYGWILFKAGNTEESLPILEKAHELQPDSLEIATHLTEAYRAVGRDSDAKQIIEKLNGGT